MLSHGNRIEPESHASLDPSPASALSTRPNVRFLAADWLDPPNHDAVGPYDVILAFSVIKWIHLEHLDDGLLRFFAQCASSITPGGYLVIELQTWDSYQKAIRPNKAPHYGQSFQALQYRPETSFTQLLATQGLSLCATSEMLPRRIDVYRKGHSHAN